ncbi:alpha carbonic anhydrase [Pavlovales sp. CCMP2436]|nr:alpha carbonic anhydrase [Pavlovales sp. CCMP2436]|mmetsp:Transcript_1904/g.5027  ORF Transcript_1904/g.5027 Transcript_1904/m.5027 type:complete len:285 (+) Transcript_1904:30-884(+)|eukprot:CAMPEP_0179897474 /NCGR_PEP_ID=MMETSP0982-20121206/37033_1 /TAXON_ID=483367 /ORGANISM="non described non described, Strain CCMP 2436" /LENGTH=284 /DNA_ID=CAMNT_0021794523 /DNA_START=11 /DNA_END=865 /DNA_ORIENTATION=-
MPHLLSLVACLAFASTVCGVYTPACGGFGADETFTGICSTGESQSPIDIALLAVKPGPVMPVYMHYPSGVPVTWNGHKWSVTEPDAYVMRDGEKFNLIQFHMHAPAEHTIDGVYTPAEAHFVHQNPITGQLLVIGVRFSGGEGHESLWLESLSVATNDDLAGAKYYLPMAGSSMLNGIAGIGFYTYMGSLTAGSCAEDLIWIVSKYIEPASTAQICSYESTGILETVRHTNPLNGRTVYMGDWFKPPICPKGCESTMRRRRLLFGAFQDPAPDAPSCDGCVAAY